MSQARVAAFALLIAIVAVNLASLDKRVDRDLGRQVDPPEAQVIVAERRAAHATPTRRLGRIVGRPVAAGRLMYRYVINRRIAATQMRLRAALAQDPDDFDGRERLWMRLHRLQNRRDHLT